MIPDKIDYLLSSNRFFSIWREHLEDIYSKIDDLPCLVAKEGEVTRECDIINKPCRNCRWRAETIKDLEESLIEITKQRDRF